MWVVEAVHVDDEVVEWSMDDKMLGFIGFNAFLHNGANPCGFAFCRKTIVLSVEVEF
jgi:hypothetical protein